MVFGWIDGASFDIGFLVGGGVVALLWLFTLWLAGSD